MSSRGRFRLAVLAFSLLLLAVGASRGRAQEETSVTGWVLDREGGAPIPGVFVQLQGTSHETFTDSVGLFRFPDVAWGTYLLSLDHLAFGARADTVEVSGSGDGLELVVRVAAGPVELAPLVVEVLSREERDRRSSGVRANVVTREELEEYTGGGQTLSGVLNIRVPGISLDRRVRPACVEFRNAPSLMAGCRPPLVIVDGVRISEPNRFLENIPLEHVESVRVLPAAAAGVRYGTGSAWGVVRVETRRPPSRTRHEGPPGTGKLAYDWDLEPVGHPWLRALGGATLGTLGGLAIALGASGDCSPVNDTLETDCPGDGALLGGIATFTFPVAGGALGANLLGRTERSRGDFLMTTLAAMVPMFSGYFFATPRRDGVEFPTQQMFGRTLVVAGIPIVATLADKLFRSATRASDERH